MREVSGSDKYIKTVPGLFRRTHGSVSLNTSRNKQSVGEREQERRKEWSRKEEEEKLEKTLLK